MARIADWIMVHLDENTALLSDTGIMTPLLLQLKFEALRRFQWQIPIVAMKGYPAEPFEMMEAIRDLRQRAGDEARIVMLLSVNSTGQVAQMFRALSPPGSEVVALFHTEPTQPIVPTVVLCNFPVKRFEVGTNGKCEECGKPNQITIDPVTLERHLHRDWVPLKPNHWKADENRQFWEMADQCDAVRLHLNVSYPEAGRTQT